MKCTLHYFHIYVFHVKLNAHCVKSDHSYECYQCNDTVWSVCLQLSSL